MTPELNVLALIKGSEQYIFVYDDASRQRLLDTFRDKAADPEWNFTWFDAAVLSEKARLQGEACQPVEDVPPARL